MCYPCKTSILYLPFLHVYLQAFKVLLQYLELFLLLQFFTADSWPVLKDFDNCFNGAHCRKTYGNIALFKLSALWTERRGEFGFIECTGLVDRIWACQVPCLRYFQKLSRINATTISGALSDPSKQQPTVLDGPDSSQNAQEVVLNSVQEQTLFVVSTLWLAQHRSCSVARKNKAREENRRWWNKLLLSLSLALSFKERIVTEREKRKGIRSGGRKRRKKSLCKTQVAHCAPPM